MNVLCRTTEGWDSLKEEVADQVMQKVVDYGGSITGEHGVGLTKRKYLPLMFSEKELSVFGAIKEALDPHHLLNPGKAI